MVETPSEDRIIGVVDDDESIRLAIGSLLRSLGFQVEMFDSAEGVLSGARLADIACLIVDVSLPGMSGLDLQRQLAGAHPQPPMVFISARNDPVAQRQALAAGALAFLRKPFLEKGLIAAVHRGLASFEGATLRLHKEEE
jgi:FixJ family two-component response regulator